MASEDVIELGSSDEESAPAPKKIKRNQNAMVHIPNKFRGITIKTNTSIPISNAVGKNVSLTKVAAQKKTNGKPVTQTKIPIGLIPKVPIKKTTNTNVAINPASLMKKFNNSQIKINKIPANKPGFLMNPIAQGLQSVKNLPPSITVKKTSIPTKVPASSSTMKFVNPLKRLSNITMTNARKKIKPNLVPTGEVLTVELDDDETSEPSKKTDSPQWYLRPEEQTEQSALEQVNNAEPKPTKLEEITIEDSPVKPVHNKRICEVSDPLSITIEDSPAKDKTSKPKDSKADESGASGDEKAVTNKVPHSKKKLEYPKETIVQTTCIEIELEPIESDNSETVIPDKTQIKAKDDSNKDDKKHCEDISIVIEIEESPAKPQQQPSSNTPKKIEVPKIQSSKINQLTNENVVELVNEESSSEFHPVYQSFINLCLKLEDSDDMRKIVEKKIKGYYRQVPKEYTESEQFVDMVAGKILLMKAGPEKMYLFIKDVVDELNLQRKMAKTQAISNSSSKPEPEPFLYGEDSQFDDKRQRQIRKLEKTLKKLHRAIQKLEEQEVDFDDEEDSVYLLTESDEGTSSPKEADKGLERNRSVLLKRYKERMVQVHAKFCQLTNTKMPSEPRVVIEARPGQPSGPAKRLEKYVNKKVPIGTPLPFPDFHDVLRCVREANTEDKLGWNEVDIMEEARDLFTRCGRKLQRRRQENEWRLAASRLPPEGDPAENSEALQQKLNENKQTATKKETEVFNKYADRQSQLKLEAVEIGDKEAEESPAESEDEQNEADDSTSTSLEDKEKRKERIRRLLQEKSKKSGVKDDNSDTKEPDKENNSETNNSLVPEPDNQKSEKPLEQSLASTPTVDVKTNEVVPNTDEGKKNDSDNVYTVSDGDKIDSDVDELHLLQKLHSENEVNSSTLESSDTETPIDISDTILSSSDNKGKVASDVISIENSSYSESELNANKSEEILSTSKEKACIESMMEVDTDALLTKTNKNVTVKKSNNDEYKEPVENILLASSEDDEREQKDSPQSADSCVNLKDDAISIGDTVVQGADLNTDKSNSNDSAPIAVSCGSVETINDDSQESLVNLPGDTNAVNDKNTEETSPMEVDLKNYSENLPEIVTNEHSERDDKTNEISKQVNKENVDSAEIMEIDASQKKANDSLESNNANVKTSATDLNSVDETQAQTKESTGDSLPDATGQSKSVETVAKEVETTETFEDVLEDLRSDLQMNKVEDVH